MSKLKTMLGVLAAVAASGQTHRNPHEPYKETEEDKQWRFNNAKIAQNINNGLKEFFYGEHSTWAINQKNADKKARKNNWI